MVKVNKNILNRNTLFKIWNKLNKKRRLQLGLLFILMIASAISEIFSLAAVIPFLAILTNPLDFWEQDNVKVIANILGINSVEEMIFPIIFTFGLLAICSASIRLSNLWFSNRLAASIGSDLSCSIYENLLHQPYEFHLEVNTSSIINSNVRHINETVKTIELSLQFISSALIAISLIFTLTLIDGTTAWIASIVFAFSYLLIIFMSRKKLKSNSIKAAMAGKYQLKALQEGLGAIREVLLDSNQNTYIKIYRNSDLPLRITQANSSYLSVFPRFSLEAIGLLLIAIITGVLISQDKSNSFILPLLGSLAFGAQRLLPVLQQMYAAWAGIRANSVGVSKIIEILYKDTPNKHIINSIRPIRLYRNIELKNICFQYKINSKNILKNIDFNIYKGEKIGIVGKTGCGKSTFIDILMGLLKPTEGKVLIDGIDIYNNDNSEKLLCWRSSISHVPQVIYLADTSIAENIAFGKSKEEINLQKVRHVAKLAHIDDFIENLPAKYETFVGERGVRLSGGQIQRIGIARALYKENQLLILDEATSALDNTTEFNVIESIANLTSYQTLIIIAHRLSTLKHCDRVINLVDGNIAN